MATAPAAPVPRPDALATALTATTRNVPAGASTQPQVTREPPATPKFKATNWPEADRLFHRDPNWLGADSASSVDLGKGRVLWLFGDTFIANTPNHLRTESTFIHNSIAVQTGRNPATASMQFFWRRSSKNTPTSFFSGNELPSPLGAPAPGNVWSWPGAGVRVGDSVVVFLTLARPSKASALGFEVAGTRAIRIPNPDDAPDAWRIEELTAPTMPPNVHMGAAVSSEGRYVLAYAFREPSHTMYLARWPKAAFERGEIGAPEWSTGKPGEGAWSRAVADAAPTFKNGATELTASRIPGPGPDGAQRHLEMQTFGVGGASVGIRAADSAAGPWSRRRIVFRPPEATRPDINIYAAKLHPELTGAPHVATYNTNTLTPNSVLKENDLYYPRFIRLEEVQ
jgi:hypothetical protein